MEECSTTGILLTDAVEQYMIASFNDKKAYAVNLTYHAKLVWKELFWKTLFRIAEVSVPVEKDDEGYFIRKPKGLIRLIGVTIKDAEGYKPLLLSPDVPTEVLISPEVNKCAVCGSGDNLCNVIESKVVIREEYFNGVPKKLKTYFETLGSGEVVEVEEYLQYDETKKLVEVKTRKKNICKVEVKECGCIKPTFHNTETLATSCGIGVTTASERLLQSKYGYFNHKIEGGKIRLQQASDIHADGMKLPDRLILSYQTNGEDELEIVIPEYALPVLFAGINYYSNLFRSNQNRFNIRELRAAYYGLKEELLMFMFPFDINAFAEVQGIMPKW